MDEFASRRSYDRFRDEVTHRLRYFRSPESEVFLQTVLSTSKTRVENIPTGAILYRAQLGHDWWKTTDEDEEWADPCGHPANRMVPLTYQAREGRANAKGIPVLYVATNENTALAEVRPWIGARISGAQFKVQRDLRIVNCSADKYDDLPLRIYFEDDSEPSAEDREQIVWAHIDRAFSTPVDPSDMNADYAVTQVLAEFFHIHGFDGVAYHSALGKGHNIALFDLTCAKLVNCSVYELEKIDFTFDECANRYFIKEETPPE